MPSDPNLSAEVLLSAREIALAAEQLATLAAEQLTPEVLKRLATHAESLARALTEFRTGCNEAAKQAVS